MKYDSHVLPFFVATTSLIVVGCTVETRQPKVTEITESEAVTIARRVRAAQAELAETRSTAKRSYDAQANTFEQSIPNASSKTPAKQVWMITARGCSPCEQWKQTHLNQLRKAGWSVGEADENQFRIIDVNLAGSIFPSLKETWCPHFVYIIDGKLAREAARGIGANFSMNDLRTLISDGNTLQLQSVFPNYSRRACNPGLCVK